jgi:DNA-binding MarR family transcriptional regulator
LDSYQDLATRPGFLIRRLHQIHVALFFEECASFGVTPVQYSLLTALARHPGSDQAHLGAEIGIDRTTTAEVLTRLGARGLIARFPSPTDKRLRLARLTPDGEALLAAMDEAAQRAHARTVEALPEVERDRFLKDLMRLVAVSNGAGRARLRLP